MKKIKHIAILACALAMVPMAFSSCDAVNGLVEKVPGLEGVIDGIIGDKHEHVFSDATCTEPKKCECGAVEGEPLGHTYVEGKCACGAEDENYVPPHVHNYNAVVTAPTCTVAGYTTYTCECGDTYTADEVAAPGHKYESEVTAPTCTVAGYTTYTCDCGDTYTEAGEAAKGHFFIDSVCHCGAEYVAPEATDWTLITELKEGVQVLIGAPAYGKLLSAEKVSAGSYYNKGVDYTVENFGNVTDAEIFVVTVNADKTYTFTSLTGKVIALAASYSSLNDTGVHKSWSLVDKGNGLFLVKNTGRNTYLEWYSSKNNWSTYTAGNTNEYELSFYAKQVSAENHVHNYISEVTAPTCTVDGYTTYTCACGATYTADEVTAPGHKYVDGKCACGEEDPSVHKHSYTEKVTATCTEDGYKTYTCACGDTYKGDEVAKLGHVDENLDVDCDREGCTSKIAPQANSTLSTFTANCVGSKVSTSAQYYVEGVIVEVLDAKNGIFLIDDGSGEKFYFRLPKNAEGVAHSSWTIRLTSGDKVRVYGKINKYSTSSAPNGQYWPAMQSPVVTLLEQHEHQFSAPSCTNSTVCACLTIGQGPLGHINENEDNLCDRCGWDMNLKVSNIVIATDTTLSNGVVTNGSDGKAAAWTWSDDNFDAIIAKGTSTVTLYTTAKAYMQLKKQNTFTLDNKNDVLIKTVTISVTSATYFELLKTVISNANLTYTKDETAFTITVEWNSTEDFVISNTTTSTIYVSGVEIVYE